MVLVCGSRDWQDWAAVADAINALPENTIVVQGGAKGADTHARTFALKRGLFVAEIAVQSSHWEKYGKGAGFKRNYAMLDLLPDLVLAFQRDGSKGTQSTIKAAKRRGIPVEVHSA